MAGNKVSKEQIRNLRELETRLTLRRVRRKGHIYVELRQDGKEGKRLIFFCVLCRARCYGDSTLFEHLRGKLHRRRYAGAELTLFGPKPWPFNDGFFFFYDSADHDIAVSGPPSKDNLFNFATFSGEMSKRIVDSVIDFERVGDQGNVEGGLGHAGNLNVEGRNGDTVVQGILWKEQFINLDVKLVGLGKIGAKIDDNYGVADEMISIWSEWLGKNPTQEDISNVPEHDYGIVVFSCDIPLGRNAVGIPSPSSPYSLSEDEEEDEEDVASKKKKKIKSFSDPEDISTSLSRRGGSYGATSVQDGCDHHIQSRRYKSKRATKKKLQREKRLQRIAEQRVCDMCLNRLLPGKDVACLLHMKTRRLVCSSGNNTGAFHVFHTSCLLHWILVCEFEIWKNQLPTLEMTHQSGRSGTKRRTKPKEISSPFCPQCHCTGNSEDPVEKPKILPLSQIFEHKLTVMTKNKEWMEKPEILQNRSTGLRFISQFEGPIKEKVILQKLVRFYRAEE